MRDSINNPKPIADLREEFNNLKQSKPGLEGLDAFTTLFKTKLERLESMKVAPDLYGTKVAFAKGIHSTVMKHVTSIVREATMLDNLQTPLEFISNVCKHAVQEMQHLTTEETTKRFNSNYSSFKGGGKGGAKGGKGGEKRKLEAIVAEAVKKATVNFAKGGGKNGAKGGNQNLVAAKGKGKGGKGKGGKAGEQAKVLCNHCYAYHLPGLTKCFQHPSFNGTKPD